MMQVEKFFVTLPLTLGEVDGGRSPEATQPRVKTRMVNQSQA